MIEIVPINFQSHHLIMNLLPVLANLWKRCIQAPLQSIINSEILSQIILKTTYEIKQKPIINEL